MRYIIPFSLSFILQLGIISITLSLLNLGINSIGGIDQKISKFKQEYKLKYGSSAKLPRKIEKFEKLNLNKHVKKIYWCYISMIVIYFILILINNFIPEFSSIRKFIFQVKDLSSVKLLLLDGKEVVINKKLTEITLFFGIILSWIEFVIILISYSVFAVILKNYVDTIKPEQ